MSNNSVNKQENSGALSDVLRALQQEEVIAYMEEVGDSKKAERESVGLWVMLYTLVFAILAYLWKRKIWSEVH